ncbi:M28 family metallopeptidase [Gammaproteobacteria bacterium]|nr:M28 family metallopeptidase [Gammaproteobacteria bacterium]MDB2445188.1 M28 family metallopeptidase [Gammaproteobacteria bacterium]
MLNVPIAIAALLGAASVLATEKDLYEIATAPSDERIADDIQALVDFGTRHTLSLTQSNSRGIGAARRWLTNEFEEISENCGQCLEILTVGDIVSGPRIPNPTEVVNIVAILRGSEDPNRFIIMSGDIDSRVSDPMDSESDSPGANDNASGLAGVVEAARVLTKHRFKASVAFVGLSGEEQGLYGGAILAEYALEKKWNVDAVINNDMIGNISGENGVVNNTTARVFSEGTRYTETEEEARMRRFQGGEVDSASRNLARYIKRVGDQYVPNLDVMVVYRLDRFARGGHHRPFNEVGFPAVRIMETNENYTQQHQDLGERDGVYYGDTIDHVNFKYAAKITGLNAATLASLAWAPPPPMSVEIKGQVSSDTTLSWNKVEGAEYYRLHWRLTTSPSWDYHRDVGDVDTFTLDDIVIDNYYFGVSSVSEQGIASPIVFPGPAGAF